MITNGKDIPLNQAASALPDMGPAMSDVMQPITLIKVDKQNVDGIVQEILTAIDTRAVRLPMGPQMLSIKPEGQRSWLWETVYAAPDLVLKPDDLIQWTGVLFRVMQKTDFSQYGYVQYDIVQEYSRTKC